MTGSCGAAIAALESLGVEDLNAVILHARTLRAAAWLRRMGELVTVKIEVNAIEESEYNDAGGTCTFWSANYSIPSQDGGSKVSATDDGLIDDLDLDEDEAQIVFDAFGAALGVSESAVNNAMSEFAGLSQNYAAFIAQGESEVTFIVEPGFVAPPEGTTVEAP